MKRCRTNTQLVLISASAEVKPVTSSMSNSADVEGGSTDNSCIALMSVNWIHLCRTLMASTEECSDCNFSKSFTADFLFQGRHLETDKILLIMYGWACDMTQHQLDLSVQQQDIMWTSSEFVQLRNFLASRLTLFNSRREGQPSKRWWGKAANANNEVWLTEDSTAQIDDPAEKVVVECSRSRTRLAEINIWCLCSFPITALKNENLDKCRSEKKCRNRRVQYICVCFHTGVKRPCEWMAFYHWNLLESWCQVSDCNKHASSCVNLLWQLTLYLALTWLHRQEAVKSKHQFNQRRILDSIYARLEATGMLGIHYTQKQLIQYSA